MMKDEDLALELEERGYDFLKEEAPAGARVVN